MNINSKAILLFHYGGIVSEEEYTVIKKIGSIVTLDTDEDVDKCFKFDISTGACLNDECWMSAYRTLKII